MSKYSKEAIIDKGIELMRKNGYNGTGVQHVLQACHIPKGSFYNFFDSKQDFALQAIDKYASENITSLQAIVYDDSLTPFEQLEKYFTGLAKFYRDKKFKLTCLMSVISFEMGSSDKEISRKIEEKFNELKALISTIIDRGQKSKDMRVDMSSVDLADYLINGFNGALITMKYEQSNRAISQFIKMNMSFVKA